ncbi:MAG: PilZ domain-containing protein [Phycisphaerae bacterium]|nr:PilZ domain-containing protein [Phycisphaerae bacterium]
MTRASHAASSDIRPTGIVHESLRREFGDQTTERRRRADRRFPHRLPCQVRVYDTAQREWVTRSAQMVNISATGLAVQVGMVVPIGSRVETVIPRPETEAWRVSGTVTRTQRVLAGTFEIGIRASKIEVPSVE